LTSNNNGLTDEPSQLDLDYTWIEVFGEPLRDAEQLLWDNLKWCPETKTIKTLQKEGLESIEFSKCPDYPSGIHQRHCYVMWEAKQDGLAKIIRALKAYHSPSIIKEKYSSPEEAAFVESYVGVPHYICECLERMQFLRFQTVCDMQVEFITPLERQTN